jgi:S-disulfanyl-L-cysteine oxidoreductase SoxD
MTPARSAWACGSAAAVLRRGSILGAIVAVTIAGAAVANALPRQSPTQGGDHFADADDAKLVAAGRTIYARNCASCHGNRLQGQPMWQLIDGYADRRAPAHDATGHTWRHSDEAIFSMTKYARFPGEPADSHPAMPAFAGRLSDRDILAAIAFIKAHWPVGLRVAQAMLNPGFAGMPAGADKIDWRLPTTCKSVVRPRRTGRK